MREYFDLWVQTPKALTKLFTPIHMLVAQTVKNLPAMQVRSLGREDPLEEDMATHCSILAWRIPEAEEPGGATVLCSCFCRMTSVLRCFLCGAAQVLIAVCGLSLVGVEHGPLSSGLARAFPCGAFSCWELLRDLDHRLGSCGTRAWLL